MDNNQITAEWIAKQRQISEIVNMTYEDAPGSVVPLLKQLEKSQTAALDALEAYMQREAEKDNRILTLEHALSELDPDYMSNTDRFEIYKADNTLLRAQVASLTRERDAAKRRADAGAIRTAVRPFEKGDEHTLTKFTQFCKRLAASHKPEMPSEDRMLLLLTDLCIDRLCVSMQGLTAERDAAHAKLLQIYRYALTKQEETAFDELFSAMWDIRQIAMAPDAPTGAGSEADHAE